jgi:hypothetical protein
MAAKMALGQQPIYNTCDTLDSSQPDRYGEYLYILLNDRFLINNLTKE